MKKMLRSLVITLVVFTVLTGVSFADEVNTQGQYQLNLNHSFWQEESLSGFAHATIFGNTDDYLALFTYLGPQVRLTDKFSFYLLGGTFNDGQGMSMTTSLWLNYAFAKNNIFAEVDYYIPIDVHPHQMYTLLEYSRSFKDNVLLGLAMETFGSTDQKLGSLAYGPFFQANKLRFWLAYDETPAVSGETVFIRVSFKF